MQLHTENGDRINICLFCKCKEVTRGSHWPLGVNSLKHSHPMHFGESLGPLVSRVAGFHLEKIPFQTSA